jgi:heat shock protein HtpX
VIGLAVLASVSLPVGVVVVVIGLAVAAVNLRLGSPRRLADAIGGRVVGPGEEARLFNLVEGLCVANGLSVPELRILDDTAPNALVLGRGDTAVLICTRGLLTRLDRIELEGLIAHELAHLKRGDTTDAAWATVAAGALSLWSDAAGRLVGRLTQPDREVHADLAAVSMTRYPPGLLEALEKLRQAGTVRPARLTPSTLRLTAALWCAPLAEAAPRRVTAGMLDLEMRIGELAEL